MRIFLSLKHVVDLHRKCPGSMKWKRKPGEGWRPRIPLCDVRIMGSMMVGHTWPACVKSLPVPPFCVCVWERVLSPLGFICRIGSSGAWEAHSNVAWKLLIPMLTNCSLSQWWPSPQSSSWIEGLFQAWVWWHTRHPYGSVTSLHCGDLPGLENVSEYKLIFWDDEVPLCIYARFFPMGR